LRPDALKEGQGKGKKTCVVRKSTIGIAQEGREKRGPVWRASEACPNRRKRRIKEREIYIEMGKRKKRRGEKKKGKVKRDVSGESAAASAEKEGREERKGGRT